MTKEEIFSQHVRAVPSINAILPNGKPVKYALITAGYICLANDLEECVAEHFAKIHNAAINAANK